MAEVISSRSGRFARVSGARIQSGLFAVNRRQPVRVVTIGTPVPKVVVYPRLTRVDVRVHPYFGAATNGGSISIRDRTGWPIPRSPRSAVCRTR
jgi:hypothetical protein